jgi:hypothetical protein
MEKIPDTIIKEEPALEINDEITKENDFVLLVNNRQEKKIVNLNVKFGYEKNYIFLGPF